VQRGRAAERGAVVAGQVRRLDIARDDLDRVAAVTEVVGAEVEGVDLAAVDDQPVYRR